VIMSIVLYLFDSGNDRLCIQRFLFNDSNHFTNFQFKFRSRSRSIVKFNCQDQVSSSKVKFIGQGQRSSFSQGHDKVEFRF